MGVIISSHDISTPTHTWDWLWGGEYIVTSYLIMRGWIYRNVIFSFPAIFGGGDYIGTLYIYPPLTIFSEGVNISWQYIFTPDNIWWGVIISWHYIFTPGNIWSGGDYIVTLYFHSWQYLVRGDYIVTLYSHSWQYLVRGWLYRDIIFTLLTILVRGWLYRDIIFSLLAIFGQGVIISWHYIFAPGNIWWGGDYIVTLYFNSWQYLVRGWLYRDTIFSPLTIFSQGVIISWHYISTPGNIWWGGDYIVTQYSHPWQYLVRGWLYRDIIFSLQTIFYEGVIISTYSHPWQYLVRRWLYRDMIFSPLTIFGQGVNIWWHHIFTPDNIWWGGDYILTYFHS